VQSGVRVGRCWAEPLDDELCCSTVCFAESSVRFAGHVRFYAAAFPVGSRERIADALGRNSNGDLRVHVDQCYGVAAPRVRSPTTVALPMACRS
jgi:hypothetical protein